MSILSIISTIADQQSRQAVVPPVTRVNFVAEGDSLTADAAHGGTAPVWTDILRGQLATDVLPYLENYAVSGEAVRNGMNTPTEINEVVRGVKYDVDFNILSLLCGINDIQGDRSGVDLYADLMDYFPNFPPYGFHTIAYCLTTSRATVFDEAKHAAMWVQVQAVNALVRTGYQTDLKADILIDLQTDPLFGGYDTPTTSPYFMPDHLHYSVAGKTQLVRYIRKAIDMITAGQKGIITYSDL